VTCSCYHRQPKFNSPEACDLFLRCLEEIRRRFAMRIYGYVVMPEHVHLLVSEPEHATLADALHFLKLSFAKRLKVPQVRVRSLDANLGPVDSRIVPVASTSFWQKRYYDRNVRDARISQ
jgi:putative transposase